MAISLFAHVALLWPSATRTVRPLLHASLRPGPVSLAAVSAPAPPLVSPQPVLPPRVVPVVPAVPTALARRMPQRPKAPPEALPPAASAVPAAPPVAPPDTPAAVDAEGLRSYRLALALNARRFHQYPPQAVEDGLAGTAQVRVAVASNGLPGRVDLLRSSGHDALDREAREMLARAAQVTRLPDTLRGQAFAVDLPVEFSLSAR